MEVVQSQLYVMKVLSMALASRCHHNHRPTSRAGYDSPLPQPTHRSSDQRSTTSTPFDLPPLDDNCAKYVLSVMVLYLRQTHTSDTPLMLEDQTTDISFTEYEMGAPEPS